MSSFRLPQNMVRTAVLSGRELGWPTPEFQKVICQATPNGIACLGGQFQWVLPDGICEAYWLNADSQPRKVGEVWQDYVVRSNNEVAEIFEYLVASIDFSAEAKKFDFLAEKMAQGIDLKDYLIFVAYFIGESENA